MDKVFFDADLMMGVTSLAVVSASVKDLKKPTSTIDKDTVTKDYIPWGDGNDFPQTVIEDVDKSPGLGTMFDKQANLLYSAGLEWGKLKKDSKGNEYLEPLPENIDQEIMLWCKRSNINRYLIEASTDLYWFSNVFPEIVLSRDKSKIAQICVQAAEECRWGKQNPNTGLIDFCYISANWPSATIDNPHTKKLPVIDPYYNAADYLREKSNSGSNFNYIYPLNYASPGKKHYQLAAWNSIRESGWLEIALLVPKFKKALLENQSTIKYHIKVSDKYWKFKYEDFDRKTKEQRTEIMRKEIDSIQKLISGAEKTGNNFWSMFYSDIPQLKDLDLVKLEPIDDKIKSGQYLEEGKDASIYTMSAIGLHPALVGTMPNNGLGGAGSNIREAYNLHILTNKSRQDLILEPLNLLVVEYNGWGVDTVFRFKNQFMTTLDTGTETSSKAQQQTSNTPS